MPKSAATSTEYIDPRVPSRAADTMDRHVGDRLKRRRIALKISRAALGDLLGISPQQVGKYENAETRISAGRLYQMAQSLKVPVSYFFVNCESDPGEQDPMLVAVAGTPEGQRLLSALGSLNGDQRRMLISLAEMLGQPTPPSALM